jgi:hypothetical protein
MAMFLMASGVYILGSGAPKAFVDSKLKTRSWVDGEKIQMGADEEFELERRKRREKENIEENEDI